MFWVDLRWWLARGAGGLTGGAGDNECTQVSGDCSIATPTGGAIGEASIGDAGEIGGSRGVTIGAGGGGSAGSSYTL